MVHSIGSGLLTSYLNARSKSIRTTEDMFKSLSFQVGGDGQSITKKQLDNYISKIESNSANANKPKLIALKQIQANWDTISHKKNNVTMSDLGEYELLLALASTDDVEISEKPESLSNQKSNLHNYLEEETAKNGKGATSNGLTEYLKSLISEDSPTIDYSDEIASVTNVLADFENISGGGDYVTVGSLSSTRGHHI